MARAGVSMHVRRVESLFNRDTHVLDEPHELCILLRVVWADVIEAQAVSRRLLLQATRRAAAGSGGRRRWAQRAAVEGAHANFDALTSAVIP